MRIVLLLALAALMFQPTTVRAEPPAGTAPASDLYTATELFEIVGPVALYPDPVFASLCAASVYPDQIKEAAGYVAGLGGKAPDEQALAKWDPSVGAMARFPDVISMMATNAEWTAQVAFATVNQQGDLFAAAQEFRRKAQEAGNLVTSEQATVQTQTVTTESGGSQQVIVIESTNPEVVYVPTYAPATVVTPYAYPPGYVAGTALAWGAGIALGAAWANNYNGANWGGGDVSINNSVNVNRNTNNNVNRSSTSVDARGRTQGGKGGWQAPAGAGSARPTGAKAPAGTRPGQNPKPPAGARPSGGAGAGGRPSAGASRPPAPTSRPSALPSGGSGASARADSGRGGQSLGNKPAGGGSKPAAKPAAKPASKPAGSASPRPSSGGGGGGALSGGSGSQARSSSSRGSRSSGGGGGGGGGRSGGGGGGGRRR